MEEQQRKMRRETGITMEVCLVLLHMFPSGDIEVRNFGQGADIKFTPVNKNSFILSICFVVEQNCILIDGLVFPIENRNLGTLLRILHRLQEACRHYGCGLFVVQTVDRLRESLVRRGGTLHDSDNVNIMTMTDFDKHPVG